MSTYFNPIIPGCNPDPSVVRVNRDFFLVTSSFEYTPGVPVYHSRDLISWTLIGHALTRKSQLDIRTPEPGGGVWATTIRWHDGFFYIFTASIDRFRPQYDERIWSHGFYVSTRDIWDSESWSDPVYFDQIGFDQDVFWDDDGTVYLSSTYQKVNRSDPPKKDLAVHICTVDLVTGRSTSIPQLLRESSSGVSEGSHLFKRGKYYYLITAEGGTEGGHSEYVFHNRTGPLGAWEACPHNPVLYNGLDNEVQSTGHADLFDDAEGNWWAVLLGTRPSKTGDVWEESVFGRETFLIPVQWHDDWPVFNEALEVSLRARGPGLYEHSIPAGWRDNFNEATLQLGWYRKNTPKKTDYTLTERPGYLRLYGSAYPLSVPASPTLFLRKQTHQAVRWRTQVSFFPRSKHTEAGTVLWWDYFTFSRIGICMDSTGARIARFVSPDGATVEEILPDADSGAIYFVIDCDAEYRLGYEVPSKREKDVKWLGSVSRAVMTRHPRIGRPNTGMMLGVYAFGDKEQCLEPADFEFAEFEPLGEVL
ncbi:hypothetical protein P170DRAFT_443475 [Aspergillus steynii IBT 23096]|uniref:Beta-xylosidase C-terminal Concanavalin A-like domain-containing protein n=1 Tax=Aspergillus steynii IBT 23096 TaxID=1392250 RepID=A0A2I2GSB4_9EURO|nr:uncharacterized protein P170DRAFT_443475 [Aspergillus steynii IBT 23096]PLB55756.1 hypothetical protein P170DRAFT_443475 [Aspergillus steynii IBT 23096]